MTLRDRLPEIRGTYAEAVPMARHTWFGVGGPADVIFCPRDVNDLACFLASCPADIPLLPIGAGSNLLVRDGGVAGVVIRMNQFITAIHHDGTEITAEAGAKLQKLSSLYVEDPPLDVDYADADNWGPVALITLVMNAVIGAVGVVAYMIMQKCSGNAKLPGGGMHGITSRML